MNMPSISNLSKDGPLETMGAKCIDYPCCTRGSEKSNYSPILCASCHVEVAVSLYSRIKCILAPIGRHSANCRPMCRSTSQGNARLYPGKGRRGYFIFLGGWECAARFWKTLTFDKIYDFPYIISDLTLKTCTLYRTLCTDSTQPSSGFFFLTFSARDFQLFQRPRRHVCTVTLCNNACRTF